jgi:glutamate-5-semialdehyde dehydrogenase
MNPTNPNRPGEPLERLEVGMPLVVGGDRVVRVGEALAQAFRPGDRLVVVPETGDVLHLPATELAAVDAAVAPALAAFAALAAVTDQQIDAFFRDMARRLEDPAVIEAIIEVKIGRAHV